jgi:hypothetical protein
MYYIHSCTAFVYQFIRNPTKVLSMGKGVVLSASMATLNGFNNGLCLLLKTGLGVGFVSFCFQIVVAPSPPIKAVL